MQVASITKIWVSMCFFILQKEHGISVETPVYELLPGFLGENMDSPLFDKRKILIRHLMTHTSGFTPEPTPMLDSPEIVNLPVGKQRESVIKNSLVNEPGTVGTYSDVNYMVLGFIIEEVSGLTLDEFLRLKIVEPMELKDTCYNPDHSKLGRIVANEYIAAGHELGRPQPIRGFVHDDKAHALNGVAGHAGIFSTLHDMSLFCDMILNNGVHNGKQIVDSDLLEIARKNHTTHIPNFNRGLGFELNAGSNMGEFVELPGGSYGHTGFTGTNFAMNDATKSYVLFLTNRTHPNRALGSINHARREISRAAVAHIGLKK
ncbi:unnamed protein product [Kuraishia capsulata CBS 1993]|uniref:Beta-lactamase-related domain-containing protein n=1 Tax=Kuraishia capsulata CBS 1993 TaxID=1382522 RepID=W6MKW7_9ASCO|nr:uncharacterized protein KUCA_T00003101001 [Kuraishia capsulata CBS 1993]CDK27124.1 unnamed protein product [Kuraishia capsulata CBS 1993]